MTETDRKLVELAKIRETRREVEFEMALRHPSMRSIIYDIIRECDVYSSVFQGGLRDDLMAPWRDGKRSIGTMLILRLERLSPGIVDQMRREEEQRVETELKEVGNVLVEDEYAPLES